MSLLLLLLQHFLGVGPVPAPRATRHVFLAETCPISQAATLPLRELHGRYGAQDVRFVGVFPAKETNPAGPRAFAKSYQLAFPLQSDAGHQLTKKLHARVTPEAVVAADGCTVPYRRASLLVQVHYGPTYVTQKDSRW